MKRYNIIDLIELVDDLERITIIEALSDTERKILQALSDSDYYNTLTQPELMQITKIPERTLIRLVKKLEALGLILTFRDAIKVIGLNPALMQKKDIFRAVRLNMLRIKALEQENEKIKSRVTELEDKYGFLENKVK
jgi:Uncharacterized protein conserved in bacteria